MNKIEVSPEEDAPDGSRGLSYAEQDSQAIRDVNQELILSCIRQQELAEAATTAERQLQEANTALEAALARERHITEVLQRPLMREVAEHAFAGLSVATLYKAALEEAQVGGDFFDAFALPRGKVALALADASGKGLAAAVRTLQVKDVLRAFAREYPHTPTEILSRLNNFVCDIHRFDDQDGESFLTLALAVLDPATGEGTLVLAGGEPPLVLRAGGAVEVLEGSGFPLGVERDERYTAIPFYLAPHDTLLMVTDGITEARKDGALLGYEGMIKIATDAQTSATSLRQVGQNLLDRARSFAGGSFQDDACLLLVRRIESAAAR
jgi:serine phosphatase RsbU (regulator of sigma subunit)